MTATPEIVGASLGQAGAVSALIASAFAPLPPSAWLVADEADRRRRLEGQFAILVEHALVYGHIELTSDLVGAAVWFHNDHEVPPPPEYDSRLAAAAGPHLERFLLLDEAFEAHHPDGPHHHLAFLAVQQDRQTTGIGSALLDQHHRRLDETGMPAYLEASTTRSRDLYLRHGYRLMGEPFHLPEDGPPFWPMWRQPGGNTD